MKISILLSLAALTCASGVSQAHTSNTVPARLSEAQAAPDCEADYSDNASTLSECRRYLSPGATARTDSVVLEAYPDYSNRGNGKGFSETIQGEFPGK